MALQSNGLCVCVPTRFFRQVSAVLVLALAASLVDRAGAQQSPSPQPKSQAPAKPQGKADVKAKQPVAAKPAMPDVNKLAILIQTAVVALSQANLTGNYSVLHALAAPEFQKDNPPAKLAETFADLRGKGIDLTPIIIFSPILLKEPTIDDKGVMRLTGYYKTAPQRVHFDLLYQFTDQWRLLGIALKTAPAS
jgi:hypothetical protein